MTARFKRLRREIFESFKSLGIPRDSAAIAAIAIACHQVFGVEPSQEQQQLVNLCVHDLALV